MAATACLWTTACPLLRLHGWLVCRGSRAAGAHGHPLKLPGNRAGKDGARGAEAGCSGVTSHQAHTCAAQPDGNVGGAK